MKRTMPILPLPLARPISLIAGAPAGVRAGGAAPDPMGVGLLAGLLP